MENRELRLKWRKERQKGFLEQRGKRAKEGREIERKGRKKVNGVREFRELKWES